eukprot:TRINITY_DN8364_c0_g2_i6.p1 TRINITY_DN8364_c0_g2~~TRINITY_DN8364_c0_g2_i6.p1  ORF type:complete len:698 (+),score=104.84 TRINITY_DN8364_c0_g2_i6:66-2159(+)
MAAIRPFGGLGIPEEEEIMNMISQRSAAEESTAAMIFRSGRSQSSDLTRRTEALERRMRRLNAENQKMRMIHKFRESLRSTSFNEVTNSWRQGMKKVVHSQTFELLSGFVIILNALMVGLEQEFKRRGIDTASLDAIEHIFLCVYIAELGMRFFAVGKAIFSDRWTRFDIFLVSAGVISGWIVEPIVVKIDMQDTATFAILRTTRLLRLARTLRLLVTFKELWLLVRGLMSSIHTMMYTALLVGIVIYVFSCLSMILVTNNPNNMQNPYYRKHVEEYFDNLGLTMLTLVRFVSLDSLSGVYTPLIMNDWTLTLYFAPVFLILSIVLMNLVTAIIVNSAMEQAMQDKEMQKAIDDNKKKNGVKQLRKLFVRLDEDGSGHVCRREIIDISAEDKAILFQYTAASDLEEVFDALDVDGDDELGIDEFIDGIWQVYVSNSPIELRRLDKQIGILRRDNVECHKILQDAIKELREDMVQEVRAAVSELSLLSQPAESGTVRSPVQVPRCGVTDFRLGSDGDKTKRFCGNHDFESKIAETVVAVKSLTSKMNADVHELATGLFRQAELAQTKIERLSADVSNIYHSDGRCVAATVATKQDVIDQDDQCQVLKTVDDLRFAAATHLLAANAEELGRGDELLGADGDGHSTVEAEPSSSRRASSEIDASSSEFFSKFHSQTKDSLSYFHAGGREAPIPVPPLCNS